MTLFLFFLYFFLMLGITVLPTLTAYKSTRVQPGHKVTIEQRQDVVPCKSIDTIVVSPR